MAEHTSTAQTGALLRRMAPRGSAESHRTATPLELLFDLCFVVAVAQAGQRLVADLAAGQAATAVTGYLFVFFGIWWAWMNFTWFASAYDTDDVPYRLLTLVQIAGVLVYAAGIARVFDRNDWAVAVLGYVVMRAALITQWLRAAHAAPGPARATALRYAAGVALCQLCWIGMLVAPLDTRHRLFLVFVLAELSVPVLAERAAQTSWHPHHIAERYGLFTLIVLGESVSAATVAVQAAFDASSQLEVLLPIAAGGLLIVFGAWWIYFAAPIHDHLASNRQALPWGYGHFLVFASAAAVGAGLQLAVEQATGHAHIAATTARAAVTVPTAAFTLTVWVLHSRHMKRGVAQQAVLPVTCALVLAAIFAHRAAVPLAGLVLAAGVAVGTALHNRRPA